MRGTHHEINFLTHDELRRLLAAAKGRSVRDYCMILLAYRHGLRASEVCQLRLRDVDIPGGHILELVPRPP